MLHHGSDAAEYSVRMRDGRKWICIRPERHFSALEFDVQRDGFENVPKVLLGWPKAQCMRDQDGRIWYTDFIESSDIYYRSLHDIGWFFKKIHEREPVFTECKQEILAASRLLSEGELDQESLLDHLNRWRDLTTAVTPYMFLVLTTDETIIENFYTFLQKIVEEDVATKALHSVLKSEYCRNAVESGRVPTSARSLLFPPEPLFVPEGQIVWQTFMELEEEVLSAIHRRDLSERWAVLDLYQRFRLVVPLVFQLSEENFYVTQGLSVAMNHLLDRIAGPLVTENIIKQKDDILNFSLTQLLEIIRHKLQSREHARGMSQRSSLDEAE